MTNKRNDSQTPNDRTENNVWLFPPGMIVLTPGAATALKSAGVSLANLLVRHLSGDWGTLCESDREENELSLREGFRLLSVYPLAESGETLWIITEGDRSATTLLLPSEY